MFSAMLKAKGKQGVAARTSCAPLCAERSDASTIGGGGSTHRIGRRLADASDDDGLNRHIVDLQAQS